MTKPLHRKRAHCRRTLRGELLETRRLRAALAGTSDPASSLSIEATEAVLDEGETFVFTVNRSGDTGGWATVDVAVSGSGSHPADAQDFSRRHRGDEIYSTELEFRAGEVSKTIHLLTRADGVVEPDEGFTVTLSNPVGAVIDAGSADGLILNDDVPVLEIEADHSVRNEGDTGPTTFTFTVTREGVTDVATSVDYTVTGSGENPANASDFAGGVFSSGQVRFDPGETTKSITVNVAGDTTAEPNEEFTVTLGNASGTALIASPIATSTIFDDDAADASSLSIEATEAVQDEGETFVFTVHRSGDTSGSATVDVAVSGSGSHPADAQDFSRRRGRGDEIYSTELEFRAGEDRKTIHLLTRADGVVEPDEGFTVTLSNPNGAVIDVQSVDALILSDDPPDHVPPDDAQIIVPELVASRQVIPGDGIPRTILFRADTDTVLTVHLDSSGSSTDPVLLFDDDLESIGDRENSQRFTATLSEGKLYALVFPQDSVQRTYLVESSQGPEVLSTSIKTNLLKPNDVNGNGEVTALDALQIINELARQLAEGDAAQVSGNVRYSDVNRDGRISALDALVVVNSLPGSTPRAAVSFAPNPTAVPDRNSVDEQAEAVDAALSTRRLVAEFDSRSTSAPEDRSSEIGLPQPAARVRAEDVDELLASEELLDPTRGLF